MGGSLLWQEERLTMQISSPAAPLYSSFHGVWRRPQRARRRRRRRRRRQRLGSLSWIEEEGEENSKPINLGAACSERREPGQRKSRRFCLLLIMATCAAQDFTYILLTFDGNFINKYLAKKHDEFRQTPRSCLEKRGREGGKKIALVDKGFLGREQVLEQQQGWLSLLGAIDNKEEPRTTVKWTRDPTFLQ